MKVIVTAGGTGGHIYPALAIINKIKEESKNSEILYIGTTDRMEKDIVPALNINYKGIKMIGLNRKNPFKNIEFIKVYSKAIKEAKKLIKEFKPDIVIGVGGYITAPVIYSAHKLGIKTIIHEQNSIPGLSNKFLSHYADKVLVSFKESVNSFPKNKTIYTGNPRSEEVLKITKGDRKDYGFTKELPFIILVMGSLGSLSMTIKMKELIPSFKNKKYQVLLVTGKDYYSDYEKVNAPSNVKIIPFYDVKYMKDCDFLITRSGASTIAEITALQIPSIMVPSPYVTHNHQYKNAKALEIKGACAILEEKDFNKDNLLKMIDLYLLDKTNYQKMKKNLLPFKVSNSVSRIYEEINNLVRNDK